MEHLSTQERLNQMSFKEKVRYIWDYYKIPIIITLLVIAALSAFIYSQATKKKTYCSVAYISEGRTNNNMKFLSDSLNNALLKDNTKETYISSKFSIEGEFSSSDYSAPPKLIGQLEGKSFDIAIADKKFINDNIKNNLFIDLNTLPEYASLQLSDDKLLEISESGKENCTYGISIKGMKMLEKLTTDENEDNYLVVMDTVSHKDAAIKTIKHLLGK